MKYIIESRDCLVFTETELLTRFRQLVPPCSSEGHHVQPHSHTNVLKDTIGQLCFSIDVCNLHLRVLRMWPLETIASFSAIANIFLCPDTNINHQMPKNTHVNGP